MLYKTVFNKLFGCIQEKIFLRFGKKPFSLSVYEYFHLAFDVRQNESRINVFASIVLLSHRTKIWITSSRGLFLLSNQNKTWHIFSCVPFFFFDITKNYGTSSFIGYRVPHENKIWHMFSWGRGRMVSTVVS